MKQDKEKIFRFALNRQIANAFAEFHGSDDEDFGSGDGGDGGECDGDDDDGIDGFDGFNGDGDGDDGIDGFDGFNGDHDELTIRALRPLPLPPDLERCQRFADPPRCPS